MEMGIECLPLFYRSCIKPQTVTLSIPFYLMISLHCALSDYFHPDEINFFLKYYQSLSIYPDSIIFFYISLRFYIIYPGTLIFYYIFSNIYIHFLNSYSLSNKLNIYIMKIYYHLNVARFSLRRGLAYNVGGQARSIRFTQTLGLKASCYIRFKMNPFDFMLGESFDILQSFGICLSFYKIDLRFYIILLVCTLCRGL